MISIDTAETDEFIDLTSAVPSDFSDEFGEFAQTLIIENDIEMPHQEVLLTCTYIFHAKSRKTVTLP